MEHLAQTLLLPGHPDYCRFWDAIDELVVREFCVGRIDIVGDELEKIPGINVAETLIAFAALGGVCDCSIRGEIDPYMEDAEIARQIAFRNVYPKRTLCRPYWGE